MRCWCHIVTSDVLWLDNTAPLSPHCLHMLYWSLLVSILSIYCQLQHTHIILWAMFAINIQVHSLSVDRKIEHLAVTIFWHLFWTSIVMTCVTCHVTIKYTGVRVTQETLHMGPVTCHLSPHVCEVFVWAEKWLPCPWLPPRTNQIMCGYSEWLEARGGGI